jgi:hypothetical protein
VLDHLHVASLPPKAGILGIGEHTSDASADQDVELPHLPTDPAFGGLDLADAPQHVPPIDAMDTFLKETAQFGNLYLSDDQEAAILDGVKKLGLL